MGGESEAIIGEWMQSRGRRDRLVIATKVFELARRPGLSAANIHAAIDDSLRRLKTDYVDVYDAHHDDLSVPQAEYVTAFDELVQAGKVREFGASNFSIERLESAVALATDFGATPFSIAQDKYNLVERELEDSVADPSEHGRNRTAVASLAGGF